MIINTSTDDSSFREGFKQLGIKEEDYPEYDPNNPEDFAKTFKICSALKDIHITGGYGVTIEENFHAKLG